MLLYFSAGRSLCNLLNSVIDLESQSYTVGKSGNSMLFLQVGSGNSIPFPNLVMIDLDKLWSTRGTILES